jgi:hypothetical protein
VGPFTRRQWIRPGFIVRSAVESRSRCRSLAPFDTPSWLALTFGLLSPEAVHRVEVLCGIGTSPVDRGA